MDTVSPFVHRIRLRGPWDFAWLTEDSLPPSGEAFGTLTLPLSWFDAFGDAHGRVRLSRRFHRPTGLDDGERVWLEIAGSTPSTVTLNDGTIAQMNAGTARFDISERIEPRCCIALEMEQPPETSRHESLVDVALVIESAIES